MITNQAMTNQSESGSGQEPTKIQRRTLFGGALATLLLSSGRVKAEDNDRGVKNPFILLLKGLYQPVPKGSGQDNFGLTTVDLDDGSYSKTRIYPIFGIRGSTHQDKSIGTFYVGDTTCAYDLPGGAIAMRFDSGGTFPVVVPDGKGGQYEEGSAPLTILEATGIYRAFAGGHNNMVDKLHQLVAGAPFAGFPSSGYDEFCFCMIFQRSIPSFP